MTQELFGLGNAPRFYQNGIDKGTSGRLPHRKSFFAAQLLSAQSMISSARSLGLSGSDALLENAMVETLTALARQLKTESAGSRYPSAAAQRPNSQNSATGSESTPARLDAGTADGTPLGSLSARFESGKQGSAAIGHDPNGGTSYGSYQISSRAGSMARFLEYLDGEAPGWAARLRSSGPADTGSASGAMPETWKTIAAEDADRFAALQHNFIRQEFYLPARNQILQQTGLDFEQAPQALQEVLWSTAVQHGATGAARIFAQAAERFAATGGAASDPQGLIRDIFAIRATRFGSSPEAVRNAVANRFSQEQSSALAMLDSPSIQTG
ncbi:MAG: hypothetical protein JXB25_10895 [Deltaproteobacteria bacterium]|nr:hypothetical protein [Deltaproteobacteria bacterium]